MDVVSLATLLTPLPLSLPLPLHPGQGRGVTALAQMCRRHLLPPILLPLKNRKRGGEGGKQSVSRLVCAIKQQNANKTKKKQLVNDNDLTPVLRGGKKTPRKPTVTALTASNYRRGFSLRRVAPLAELQFFWVHPNGEVLATHGSSPTGPLILPVPVKCILYLMCLGL